MSSANAPDSSSLGNILWNWVSNSTASTSDDFATQMTCYAFPYGALGFVAHLVMFYGILLSPLDKCPWNPRKPLVHSGWDLVFGIVGFVISCIFTAITMYRCSGAKQYMFIAASKIFVTVTSSAIGINIAWNIRGRRDDSDQTKIKMNHHQTLWWFIIEFLGSILELIGVVMVLKESRDAVDKNKQSVMIISLIFVGFMGILLGTGVIWLEVRQRAQRRMQWEVRKVQGRHTTLEERVAAEQPRGRAPNRRRGTPNSARGDGDSLAPDVHEDDRRRSGQRDPVEDARGDPEAPGGQDWDIEAQALNSPAIEGEATEKPVLYHYQDVLNSAKQLLLVAGAAFSLSVTL